MAERAKMSRRWVAPVGAFVLVGAVLAPSTVAIAPGANAAGAAAPRARAIPATALLDRETIEVRGEGFQPFDFVDLWQCVGSTRGATNCRPDVTFGSADANGRVSASYTVRRQIKVGSTQRDCASVACYLVLPSRSIALPLNFVSNAPLVRSGLPMQAPCVPWPTNGWPQAAIPAGVNAAAVANQGQSMIDNGTTAVVVIHAGRVVYEKYAKDHGPNVIEPSFSMSKSFASTVIGLLAQQGKLQLDARAPVKEWAGATDPRRKITLRNILNMASGLQWNEIYSDTPQSDVFQMILREPDQAAYAIKKPLAHAPGTEWNYSTGDTAILGRIISRTANVSGSTYEQYLHKVLFDPLGINPVHPGFDQTGDWTAGWFTNMSTRNFAKLGYLYLRNGVWAGKQFLSPNWVDFVRTPSPASAGYGGQFWLEPDGSFRMVGLFGQTVHIVPQLDLIVAANNGGSTQPMVDLFRKAVPPNCGAAVPKLTADTASVAKGGAATVPVLANDTGGVIGLAPGTLTVANLPKHGTAKVMGSSIRYTPASSFVGTETFTYVVCTTDRRRCPEATATVSVH